MDVVYSENKTNRKGFTIVELVVVVAVYAILISFTLRGTVNSQVNASVDSSINTLISDIKQQQVKSMIGFTADEDTAQQFGIYFGTNSYILFTGSSYSAIDPDNFEVTLADGLSFTDVTFPSDSIVFNRRSGDFAGFSPSTNSVTITHEDTSSRLIILNKYGAISLH